MSFWQRSNDLAARYADASAACLVLLGFFHRLHVAYKTFLTPEEAFQILAAVNADAEQMLAHPIIYTHPPLSFFLYRLVASLGNSDFLLRLPFAVAGAALPLIAYLWLKRLHGPTAAWIGMFVLLMAPNLFFLGWQARGYILALLGMAVALWAVEEALARNSALWMAAAMVGLCAALLSEYMAVWFWAALGVYVLLRFRSGPPARLLFTVWAAGQAAALLLVGWLQLLRAARIPAGAGLAKIAYPQPYLSDQYPAPGENPLAFFAGNTVDFFAYLFSSGAAGVMALSAFAAAIALLSTGRLKAVARHRALVVLFLMPFLLAGAAAAPRLHPYGGTRHSTHLALFAVAGIAIALAPLFERRPAAMMALAAVLTPFWYLRGPTDLAAVPTGHILRRPLLASLEYLRREVPAGSVILTDAESRLVLSYYLDPESPWPRGIGRDEESVGGYVFYAPRWTFSGFADIREDLSLMRRRYNISPEQPVWGIDTGFICGACLELRGNPALRDSLDAAEVFGLGTAVFSIRD